MAVGRVSRGTQGQSEDGPVGLAGSFRNTTEQRKPREGLWVVPPPPPFFFCPLLPASENVRICASPPYPVTDAGPEFLLLNYSFSVALTEWFHDV